MYNILQYIELPILCITFQEICKYSKHVQNKLLNANRCLYINQSLRKEGYSQEEVDYFFSTIVLPNFTYGLLVYGASDSDLMLIQNFLERCFKRRYVSCKLNIRELLEKADRRIFKKRSSDAGHPLNNILPQHKETKYNLRVKSSHCPNINTS